MVGCGTLFVVGGVASCTRVVLLCRVGWFLVVWCRVVASLRRIAACVVSCRCVAFGGAVLCRVLVVPRGVLLVVRCSMAMCCVVSCDFRWVVVLCVG